MDQEDCKNLARECGIPERDVLEVFEGEDGLRARRTCRWVARLKKSPLERSKLLISWAKKNKSGIYSKPQAPKDEEPVRPQSKKRTSYTVEEIETYLGRMEG